MSDPVTTDRIEEALYQSLLKLDRSLSGPFVLIDRFINVGEPTQEDFAEVTGGKAPAALIAWESDESVPEGKVETLVGFDNRQVTRATFRIYVVVHDTRSDRKAVKGDEVRKGLLALVTQVKRTVLGLKIEDLAGDGMIKLARSAPSLIVHGEMYVSAVRVSAEYEEELAEIPDTSVPFKGVDGSIGVDGEDDSDDGLVVPFSHRFE